MSTGFTADTLSISQVFSGDDLYRVSEYQRKYSWEEQVDDLWSDLTYAFDLKIDSYFLGTIVIIHRSETQNTYFEVVDGQQRLATLSVLIKAMYDYLDSLDKPPQYLQPQHLDGLLFHVDYTSGNKEPRLTLNDTDNQFFQQYIMQGQHNLQKIRANARTESQKRLYNAYKFFRSKIKDMVASEDPLWIPRFFQFLCGKVRFIRIKASEDADAFQIFETINARGTPLTNAALLKNLLFSLAKREDMLSQVRNIWTRMEERLESEKSLEQFIRYYWMSKFRHLRQRDFYRGVKTDLQKQDPFREVVRSLDTESLNYHILTHPKKQDLSAPVYGALQDIKALRVTQVYPILLSAASRCPMDSEEFSNLVTAARSFIVRYFIFGDGRPNAFERTATSLARDLRSERVSIAKAIQKLRELAPGDKEFGQYVRTAHLRKVNVAKCVLRAFNSYFDKSREFEYSSTVHLEHILPQHPNEGWLPYFSPDEIEEYVHRLGNLTLLDFRLNRMASNSPFRKKKKEYRKSHIVITQWLLEEDKWTPEAIERRQKRFARVAPKIWPL